MTRTSLFALALVAISACAPPAPAADAQVQNDAASITDAADDADVVSRCCVPRPGLTQPTCGTFTRFDLCVSFAEGQCRWACDGGTQP